MANYDKGWVMHKEYTSIARRIRELSDDIARDALLGELREAHNAMSVEDFIKWCGGFRKRVEEECREKSAGSII